MTNQELVAALREALREWARDKVYPERLPGLVDEIDARLCPKPPTARLTGRRTKA